MGNIEGLDRAVAQLEKQAFDQSEGSHVRSERSALAQSKPHVTLANEEVPFAL